MCNMPDMSKACKRNEAECQMSPVADFWKRKEINLFLIVSTVENAQDFSSITSQSQTLFQVININNTRPAVQSTIYNFCIPE